MLVSIRRDGAVDLAMIVAAVGSGERGASEGAAAAWLRDAVHPAFRPGVTDAPAAGTLGWHQQRSASCARQAVADAGIDPGLWLGPPCPDRDAVAYCPRCHRQFVDTPVSCGGCGVPTLPLSRS